MRRSAILTGAVVLVFGLAACGNGSGNDAAPPAEPPVASAAPSAAGSASANVAPSVQQCEPQLTLTVPNNHIDTADEYSPSVIVVPRGSEGIVFHGVLTCLPAGHKVFAFDRNADDTTHHKDNNGPIGIDTKQGLQFDFDNKPVGEEGDNHEYIMVYFIIADATCAKVLDGLQTFEALPEPCAKYVFPRLMRVDAY